AGLPAVVDTFQLGAQLGHLLLQLRQALGLAGQLLQITAGNPNTAAVLAAHLTVVALGAQQFDLLPRTQRTDNPIAIGGTAAHIGWQAVTDPAQRPGTGAATPQRAQQTGRERRMTEGGRNSGKQTENRHGRSSQIKKE